MSRNCLSPCMNAKHLILTGIAAFALGTLGIIAQDQPTDLPPPPPDHEGPGPHHHGPPPPPPGISQSDWDKFNTTVKSVLDKNTDLKAEGEALHKEGRTIMGPDSTATDEQREAFFEKIKAHEEKVKTAVLKADP